MEDNVKVRAGIKNVQTNFQMNTQTTFGNERQMNFSSNIVGVMQHQDNIQQINHNGRQQNVSYFKTFDFIWRIIYVASHSTLSILFKLFILYIF
jgi:hypothetical protein